MPAETPPELSSRVARELLLAARAGYEVAATGATPEVVTLDPIGIAPQFSDDQLALEFVSRFGDEFRWSPGLDWMHWADTHWRRDDTKARFSCARAVCRAAAQMADDKSGMPIRIASNKTVAATVALAATDRRIVVSESLWDADSEVLNTPGGIVDLRSGRLINRNRDYLTKVAAVTPADQAVPNWLRFIGEVFTHDADVLEFVQRLCGYCLTGDRREQKLFFFWGTGANGKSTLIDLLLWLMGTYALKLPTAALMQSAVDRHPTELAQLHGRRLAVSNELDEGQFWAESRIKELTGDETLTARFMRADFFEFRQTQKHLIAGNFKPRLKGGDPAMARRLVLVPFLEVFAGHRRDSLLPVKLKTEAAGILAWMVSGAVKWYADGLAIPGKIAAASAEYMADHDDLALFLDECCERDPEAKVSASDAYQAFSLWKKDRGEHSPSITVWGQRVALVPWIKKVRSGGIQYRGLRLSLAAAQRVRNGSNP